MIRLLPHHSVSKLSGKSPFISTELLLLFPCGKLAREVSDTAGSSKGRALPPKISGEGGPAGWEEETMALLGWQNFWAYRYNNNFCFLTLIPSGTHLSHQRFVS